MACCYNNAPGVSAFHTRERADKDKHTHKQMSAGKHGQTGKKIDEQQHRWTQTQHRRWRLRRVTETQCKTGRDNKHQHERPPVHAQIYIITGLVSVSTALAAGALKLSQPQKNRFLSCTLGGKQAGDDAEMPPSYPASASAPWLINCDFQLRLSFLLVAGEPGRSSGL